MRYELTFRDDDKGDSFKISHGHSREYGINGSWYKTKVTYPGGRAEFLSDTAHKMSPAGFLEVAHLFLQTSLDIR